MKFDISYYDRLQDYIQSGCEIDLNQDELDYYNALYAMLGIYRKYGRQNAINMMINPPFSTSRRIANRMMDETINLFYLNDKIEKEAYRNMIFNNLDNAAKVVSRTAKSVESMEIYGKLMMQAYKVKGLDQPDEKKEVVQDEKEIKIYSLNPQSVGIPSINRDEIASIIDNLKVSEKDRSRIKQDANIEDVDFEEVIDDTKDKTQDAE